MKYGQALEALEGGYRVCRRGWNGKGMWLVIVRPYDELLQGFVWYRVSDIAPENCLSWIGMKTADGKFVPWLASQTDMLAQDWEVVE